MATKKPVSPPIITVGGKDEESTASTTKTSEVIHKSVKDATTLYQVLGKIEDTIQELTRLLAECPDSDHQGVGGRMIMTPKQQAIQNELEEARGRYESVLHLISAGN